MRWAQVGSGAITGVVTDSSGGALAAAVVTATNLETSGTRQTVTTTAGVYTLPGLVPGTYRLDVSKAGHQPIRRETIRVETGRTLRVDVELGLSTLAESVLVSRRCAGAAGDGQPGLRWSPQRSVTALPLNGRSFITLASLAPGVALPPGSQLPRINGGRPRTNEYLFDGISVLQPEPGQVAFFPVVDAIQEFKIETQQPAGRVRPVQRRRRST